MGAKLGPSYKLELANGGSKVTYQADTLRQNLSVNYFSWHGSQTRRWKYSIGVWTCMCLIVYIIMYIFLLSCISIMNVYCKHVPIRGKYRVIVV